MGGRPEASWHTPDKDPFSFVDTCEGFHNRHFQFCSQALCSYFSRSLLSSKGWLWPEARYPVFCAIVLPTCHTHSGGHLGYVFCIHSVWLLGPLSLCCLCQQPLGTRLEAGNPCEVFHPMTFVPWAVSAWLPLWAHSEGLLLCPCWILCSVVLVVLPSCRNYSLKKEFETIPPYLFCHSCLSPSALFLSYRTMAQVTSGVA